MKIISFLGVYSFPFRIETQCIPHIDLVTVAAVLIASRCYHSEKLLSRFLHKLMFYLQKSCGNIHETLEKPRGKSRFSSKTLDN